MDTFSAFARAQANKGNEHKVFDWEKAARLIVERKPATVRAGLCCDWEYTGGDIYRDDAPVPKDDTYTYLASNWATLEIEIDGDTQDCWRYAKDSPGWDAGTYWPAEAMAILAKAKGSVPS